MTQKEDFMKAMRWLILLTSAAFFIGCASVPPKELVNARSAYQTASEGPAGQLVPAELHKAHEALVLAEQSFQKEPDSYRTKDLAYVAQRKSELAGALGAMASDKSNKDSANAAYSSKQTELVKQSKQDLADSQKQSQQELSDSQKQGKQDLIDSQQQSAQQLSDSQKQGKQDLADSEKRTADALAKLATLAAVKEEERGLVITLSGSVLFRSGRSTLLSSAQVKLDQVAEALLAVQARNLIVEGHTDSQGSESYNQRLSQRRADAVRDYLVLKGYPSDRIVANGKGKGSPIADNASPEGRANNRRVEIIVQHEVRTSQK
jgi:outer membrane protein OmpA-like peptidoglycan-associated protein